MEEPGGGRAVFCVYCTGCVKRVCRYVSSRLRGEQFLDGRKFAEGFELDIALDGGLELGGIVDERGDL
jgi:hypothetical protein